MRILAHFSRDEKLINAFLNNDDVHGATAKNMFALTCSSNDVKKYFKHLRQVGKVVGFLLIYGGGELALYNTLADEEAVDAEGKPITQAKASEYYHLYFDTYEGVTKFVTNQKAFAHKYKFVYTIVKRKRRLPKIDSKNRAEMSYSERLAVNSPIQGSAGDVIMSAQLKLESDKVLKELGWRQVLQVHDEVVGVCPKENAEKACLRVKEIMEHPFDTELAVPLNVDYDYAGTYAGAK